LRNCTSLLAELEKLPDWLNWGVKDPVFRHLPKGMSMGGISLPQMYVKVPGVWTGGHEENSRFYSVNLNHGPHSSIWAAIAPEDAQKFRDAAKTAFGGDIYLEEGNWFPSPEFLRQHDIPWLWGVQKPGEVVVLQGGTLHWVRSGGFAVNSSWNFGVRTVQLLEAALERNEINLGLGLRSVIPLKAVCVQILVDAQRALGAHQGKVQSRKEREFLRFLAAALLRERAAEQTNRKLIEGEMGLVLKAEEPSHLVLVCDKCSQELLHHYVVCQTCATKNEADGLENDLSKARPVFFCARCGVAHVKKTRKHEFEARCKDWLGETDFPRWVASLWDGDLL
jgi:hypothetical protein